MRLRKIALFVVTFLMLTNLSTSSQASELFASAKIYFFGWNVLTRSKLSLENVRQGASIIVEIKTSEETNNFVKWLQINQLQSNENPAHEDPRLVIDLFTMAGKRVTYYASEYSLLSEDSIYSRNIDADFKKKFSFACNQ